VRIASHLRVSLIALCLGGCSSPTTTVADARSATAGIEEPHRVRTGADSAWIDLEPKDHGYRFRGGDLDGLKATFKEDRVKIKDQSGETAAKVKVKDYGFKIYRDDESTSARAKRDGAGYKISDGDGARWGTLASTGGEVNGEPVQIETAGDVTTVLRAGREVGSVDVRVSRKAAAFLALTELTLAERVAAMLFVLGREP
jgi:hypothetical protein